MFCSNVNGWDSHRPLLYLALELTKQSTKKILELGCGEGSTPYLNKYIQDDNRNLISFDTNPEWLNKFSYMQSEKHKFVFQPDNFTFDAKNNEWYDRTPEITNWLDEVTEDGVSVCLVDHACGERRHSDIKRIYQKCDIMVIHDSEPQATGYMMNKIWNLFSYTLHFKKFGAWATLVSNKYDVSKFNNLELKNFILQK